MGLHCNDSGIMGLLFIYLIMLLDCSLKWPIVTCVDGVQMSNGTCYTTDSQFVGVWNTTMFYKVTGKRRVSPSEEYWM